MPGLNPNSQPFPAYVPSPISPPHSSSSPSAGSTWSSRSQDQHQQRATGLSSPDSSPYTIITSTPASSQKAFYAQGQGGVQKVSQPFPVKNFGSDWTTTPITPPGIKPSMSMSTLTTPTPSSTVRARSPSVLSLPTSLTPSRGQEYEPIPVPVPAVPQATRARLQLPIRRPSTYDPINGHSYHQVQGQGLTHHSSAPDLMEGSYASYDRRPSLHVPTWRAGIPEEPENDHEYESELRSLSASRSVPAFTGGVGMGGFSSDTFTQSRNIYISSVPAHITEEDLMTMAEQFGDVLSLRLEKSTSFPPAESRAYVMFKDVNDAHKYYSQLKKAAIPCELAKEDYSVVYNSLEDKNSSNLYIQGFLSTDSMQFIESVIYPGVIVSSSRPKDSSGNVRGIVMARVQSRPQADEVIARLNGKWKHPMADQYLQVRIADSEAQKAFKKKHADPADSFKSPSMPNIRQGSSIYSNTTRYHAEGDWFAATPSRESSFTSLRSAGPPQTPTRAQTRTRLPSDLSLHHQDSMNGMRWSSRVDQWTVPGAGTSGQEEVSTSGPISTPTSQFFGVAHGNGNGNGGGNLKYRSSSSNLALEQVRSIWAQPSAGY